MNKQKEYFEGLNSLRFFAAFLVLIGHCNQNLIQYGIDWMTKAPILYKGGVAVDFFFVLSGFLLTYLARKEYDSSGTIAISSFFKRRILRIFPLYYFAVFLGYFLLGYMYPLYKGEAYFNFPIWEGLPYHLFFLPNYAVGLYGEKIGAMFSLWSIGVEEQYYLIFPFLMLLLFKLKRSVWWMLGIAILYFVLYRFIQTSLALSLSEMMLFFWFTLKFHLMLYGGFVAMLLYHYPEKVETIISNRLFQIIIWGLSLSAIIFQNYYDQWDILHSLIFGVLILVVTTKKGRLINLEIQPFVYLGTISFGIYVYHPFVSYFLRLLLEQFDAILTFVRFIPLSYYLAELLVTIFVAHLSYQYYEKYFLKFKSKKQT